MANTVNVIKRIAMDAVNAGKPMSAIYGVVELAEPLTIVTEQKLTLTSDFLILTDAVRDYTVEMEVDHVTETVAPNITHSHASTEGVISNASPNTNHNHAYRGRKRFKVLNSLKVGESVMLLQLVGGQRYLVLGRTEARE